MANKHVGSSFDDFLKEEKLDAGATAVALKRVIAWQIEEARKARRLTKAVMAARMGTSRAQLDRVLDASNTALTIDTLSRAATAVGKRIKFELVAA
jgi:antitoxin HicB